MTLYILFVVMFVYLILRFRENRPKKKDLSLEQLRHYSDLEENGEKVLEIIGGFLDAPTYSLYRWDKVLMQYQLISARIQTEQIGEIRPSYSGLVPYKREVYYPPNTLPMDTMQHHINTVSWVNGEVPSMNLSLSGGQWLIRIGPIKCPPQDIIRKFERIITELNRRNEVLNG